MNEEGREADAVVVDDDSEAKEGEGENIEEKERSKIREKMVATRESDGSKVRGVTTCGEGGEKE